MTKAKDLRDKNEGELSEALDQALSSLRNFRFQSATGALENHRSIRNTRREIARIKTILRERELAKQREARN
ncbi:MAG: 50S ribosomal protein L29 [Candidatus Hydrogenedentota bacterium]